MAIPQGITNAGKAPRVLVMGALRPCGSGVDPRLKSGLANCARGS
jgi:hypothetical protein